VGLWNPEARQLLRSIDRHQLWVNLVVYSPRGDLLASSGNEGIIHIQDAEQAKPISSVRGFPTGPPAVAFSPDGRRLVYSLARGRLKELRLWEVGSGLDLLSLPGQTAPLCACFSPDGTTLASGGADGTITLWLTQAQPWTSGGNNAVPKDAAEAVAVFRQAAEQGSAAEYNLGKAYENGEGVAKDLAVAAKWYRGAAEGGNRAAMASLLNLYRRGAIEAKSPGEVVTWYHKLAEGYLNTLEPVQSAAAREDALALNNFSWLLATCPNANVRDGAAAVVFAEKAVAGTSRKAPLYLDTLAAAYAEAGQFTNAVSTQREAVGLVQGRADKAGYAARLKLYESNSPYREASQNPPPPAVDNPVEVAALLQARGRLRAQYGQWKKAIPDLARALELKPNDDLIWYLLAPLLLEDGDVAGYHKHCQAMLARFGATDDLPTVSRIAKGAMLLPLAAADLTAASKLAETAVTVGRNDARAAYFQFVKGLAEYREGRFATAAEWAKKALNKPSEDSQRDAQAYAVLAMAYHQLGQTNEARAILANAKEVTDTKLPKADSGDLGEAWNNVLIARILLREANTLIGGGGSAGSKP
jgi:tetratricopeptide (TPR) repeat protein